MEDEPSLMTTEVMLSRMRDYGVIGVSQTASLIMGGVFATAAVTFIEIVRAHDALPERVSGWLFGVAASLVMFDSSLRRSLLEGRPTFHAIPIIGAAGILSMMGFAMLSPQAGGADGWRYSQLVVFLVGLLFFRSWGSNLADYVEPALQPLYDAHRRRSEGRWRMAWATILCSLVPFALAMAEKFSGVSLRWPIVATNLVLCAAYFITMRSSHRYMTRLYDRAYAAHAEKLRPVDRSTASGIQRQ
jgi:hypothetical protein